MGPGTRLSTAWRPTSAVATVPAEAHEPLGRSHLPVRLAHGRLDALSTPQECLHCLGWTRSGLGPSVTMRREWCFVGAWWHGRYGRRQVCGKTWRAAVYTVTHTCTLLPPGS